MSWCTDLYNWGLAPELEFLYGVPNAGKRTVREGSILVGEGMKRGVYDLCLPAARQGYHGLYLDMKVGKDDLSDDQKRFARYLERENYFHAEPKNVREAQDVMIWYLGLRDNPRVVRFD